jgi:putative transposase
VTADVEVIRAYRVTLDPTPGQVALLRQHAGASRWAFNTALAAKIAARRQWEQRVQETIDGGADTSTARTTTKVRVA